MAKKKEENNLVNSIIECIIDKKGNDIVRIDFGKIENAAFKTFVICHADTGIQVRAIVDHIERQVRKLTKEHVWKKEGLENSQWVLLDYIDVVVHVFQTQYREFYNLENLWADAEIKKIENPD